MAMNCEETRQKSECEEWQGPRSRAGYGRVGRGYAHRVAYERLHGPIPAGMVVRHRCDNPPCVNPAHLELGTHADNMRDMAARGRSFRGEPRRALMRRVAARGMAHGTHTRPEGRPRGERNGHAKLTEATAREVRAAYAAGGTTQRELAARFGVTQMTVSDLVTRKTWAHVGAEEMGQ